MNAKAGFNGWTPLHFSVHDGRREIAGFLLQNGADPNARDEEDRTPLAYATEKGDSDMIDMLRKYGLVS